MKVAPTPFQSTVQVPALGSLRASQSFSTVLANGKSASEARSERALGFQEAGLLGLYRSSTGNSTGKRSATVLDKPSVHDNAGRQLAAHRNSFVRSNEDALCGARLDLPKSASRGDQKSNAKQGALRQTVNLNAQKFYPIEESSPFEVGRTAPASKYIYCSIAERRRWKPMLLLSSDGHDTTVSIGMRSQNPDDAGLLIQALTNIFQEYGVTPKSLMINGVLVERAALGFGGGV